MHKKTKPYYYLAQQWGNFPQSVYGIVGVLAKGGKVLDDLAALRYVVAELAGWVGPTTEGVAQVASQGGQPPSLGGQGPAKYWKGGFMALTPATSISLA